MSKNWVKMASKMVFIGGGAESAPPATWDAFQMLPLVGLKILLIAKHLTKLKI